MLVGLIIIIFLSPFVACHDIIAYQKIITTKRLSSEHTFLDQFCVDDDNLSAANINKVVFKLSYHLFPKEAALKVIKHTKTIDTAQSVADTLKAVHLKEPSTKKYPLSIFTWIELVDGSYQKLKREYVHNNSWTNIEVHSGIECVEFRYMLILHHKRLSMLIPNNTRLNYEFEIMWMGDKKK